MNVNSILNSSIKVLMITTLVIALCISAIFILPPSYGLDFSSYFSNQKNNGDSGTSSVNISGNVVTINANKTSYGYNSSIDFCIGYTCSFTCTFELSDNSNLSYPLVNAISSVDVQFTDLVNCTVSGSTITPTDYSGSFSMVCNNSGGVRFRSTAASANTDYIATYGFSNIVIDDTPFGDTASYERTITIRPGYAAYIETAGGTLDLIAQFPNNSAFTRPFWDDNVRIAFGVSGIPSTGDVFNSSFGSSIDWLIPASADKNWLGKSKTGGRSYSAGLPDNGSFVVIVNPAYQQVARLGDFDYRFKDGPTAGPTITATFSNVVGVHQYKLLGSTTFDNSEGWLIESGSPDNYNTTYVYTPKDDDPSTIVTDSDYRLLDLTSNTSGPAIGMTNGGYNSTDEEFSSAENADNTISGLLDRILQFLTAPVQHIINLTNAGGDFMYWLGSLWTWLPTDVAAILVDALIVLVVIGAIKFLWK